LPGRPRVLISGWRFAWAWWSENLAGGRIVPDPKDLKQV